MIKFPTPQDIEVALDAQYAGAVHRWCTSIAKELANGAEGENIEFTNDPRIQRLVKAAIEADGLWTVAFDTVGHCDTVIIVKRK